MLFELDPRTQDFCVTLNGENRREVDQIVEALNFLSLADVVPPPDIIHDQPDTVQDQRPRTIEGRLDVDRGLFDAKFMIRGALNFLSDWERSAGNDSLVFRLRDVA